MPKSAQILVGFAVAFGGGMLVLWVTTRPAPVPTHTAAAPSAPSAPIPPPPEPEAALPPPRVELPPLEALLMRALDDLARLDAMPLDQRTADLERWSVVGVPRYALLERGGDARIGERVLYRGRVEEIRDRPGGGSMLRVALRTGGRDIIWVETVGRAPDWVERGARVRVAGYLAGEHTYESQAGWSITLPAVLSVALLRDGR